MARAVRPGVGLIVAALLLATGCSNSDGTSGSAGPATSTSTTSAPIGAATTTSTPPLTTNPTVTVAPTSIVPAGTNTTASAGPAVATAEGWRLAVSRPTAGATVGPTVTVCYEATGASREPDLALEVTALRPGTTTGGAPVQVNASVGRGSVAVALTGVAPGVYDLRIELIPNGVRVNGLAVTIPSVTVTAGGPAGACP